MLLKNRYFIVFRTLDLAREFCQKMLAPLILKPREGSLRIELRGIVVDNVSGKAFCVINLIFPNTQLVEEEMERLEKNLFQDDVTKPS
jgi:hypothetical protein